jgi:hypothetical protein
VADNNSHGNIVVGTCSTSVNFSSNRDLWFQPQHTMKNKKHIYPRAFSGNIARNGNTSNDFKK